MTCPRCAVATIDPSTGSCELCGFRADVPGLAAAADPMLELVTRELAHEFELIGIAGRRNGGIVFNAEERNSGRAVALKVVVRATAPADAESHFRSRMEEFQRLDHPHLLPLLRFGTSDSLLWCATVAPSGRPLRAHLAERGRLEPPAARRIATQLVSALEYLHRRQLGHGGIKPENVFIDSQGWVWLADPEYARPAGGDAPRWLAPEFAEGAPPSAAADQYALSALLFECVTGEPPAGPGDRAAQFRPEVPRGMSRALSRALAESPARRFASCAEFLVALEQDEGGRLSPVGISQPRSSGPTSPIADTARPSTVPNPQVLLIPDWEPPEEEAKPKGRALLLVSVGIVIGALAFAMPSFLQLLDDSRVPAVSSAPLAVPTPTSSAASSGTAPVAAGTASEASPAASEPDARQPGEVAPSSIAPVSAPRSRTPRPAAATEEVAAPEPAKLFINASPWGQVFIDDVLVGNTPRANLEVAPGEHVIRVSRQGFSTFTRTVRLTAGETLRITDIVLTPTAP